MGSRSSTEPGGIFAQFLKVYHTQEEDDEADEDPEGKRLD